MYVQYTLAAPLLTRLCEAVEAEDCILVQYSSDLGAVCWCCDNIIHGDYVVLYHCYGTCTAQNTR